MLLSVIIVTYNSEHDIRRCLDSVRAVLHDIEYEVIVIDNCSADRTAAVVNEEFPWVTLQVLSQNIGFAAGNNVAMSVCSSRYLLLLNPDTEVEPNTVQEMIRHMERSPQCGLAGPRLLNGDGIPSLPVPDLSLVSTFLRLVGLRRIADRRAVVPARRILCGACLLIRASTLSQIGLLDDGMHTQEDGDYCIRARQAGWSVDYLENIWITHFVGGSKNPGYVIRRSYESAFKLHGKHAALPKRICIYAMLSAQMVLRLGKWAVVSRNHPGAAAKRKALAGLLVRLPGLWCGQTPVVRPKRLANDSALSRSTPLELEVDNKRSSAFLGNGR